MLCMGLGRLFAAMLRRSEETAGPAVPQSPGAASPAARVTVSVSRPERQECEHAQPESISELIHEEGIVLWVDIANPGAAEVELLRREFGFHRLALEDVTRQRQRPKIDEYPDYYFVVMYAPADAEEGAELRTEEVDVFVGANYLVTCHRNCIPSLSDAASRWERTESELRGHVGFLLHVVADSVIDSYFPIVETIQDRVDALELNMFKAGSQFDAGILLGLKRDLHTVRKAVEPLREVFNTFLRHDKAIFSQQTYPYFQDVYDHVLRILDLIDIERDMTTGALEAQLSVASNRLNETMKRLTVIAICVAIMGAVFGAWGMNFSEVPLDEMGLFGFAAVCGGTTILVGLVLIIARRLDFW